MPRSTKMGNIPSLCPFDVVARHTRPNRSICDAARSCSMRYGPDCPPLSIGIEN